MAEEKIAILLAVYNGENHINDLLSSLFLQTYSNIKIYIRDNCSTDNTLSLLQGWKERYSEKIELLSAEINEGCIANFSALLEAAKEQYVLFCDHDDIWLPEKISVTFDKMQEMEKMHGKNIPLAVHSDLTVVDANLKIIAPSFWKISGLNPSKKACTFSRLLVQNQITGCTLMINKSLAEVAAPIPKHCMMHDWWIALVASCFGKIGIVDQPTILYRQHTSNDTGAKAYKVWSYLFRKDKQKNKDLAKNKKIQVETFINRYQNILATKYLKTSLAYLKMQQSPLPIAFALLIRYKFFKTGFLRNFIFNH